MLTQEQKNYIKSLGNNYWNTQRVPENGVYPEKFYHVNCGSFYFWDDCEKSFGEDFVKFMRGQTVMQIGEHCVVYAEDYERFINNLPVID